MKKDKESVTWLVVFGSILAFNTWLVSVKGEFTPSGVLALITPSLFINLITILKHPTKPRVKFDDAQAREFKKTNDDEAKL